MIREIKKRERTERKSMKSKKNVERHILTQKRGKPSTGTLNKKQGGGGTQKTKGVWGKKKWLWSTWKAFNQGMGSNRRRFRLDELIIFLWILLEFYGSFSVVVTMEFSHFFLNVFKAYTIFLCWRPHPTKNKAHTIKLNVWMKLSGRRQREKGSGKAYTALSCRWNGDFVFLISRWDYVCEL